MENLAGPFRFTFQILDRGIEDITITFDGRTTPPTIQLERNGNVRQLKADDHQRSLIEKVVEMSESDRLFDVLRSEEADGGITAHMLRWSCTYESGRRIEKAAGSFVGQPLAAFSLCTHRFHAIMGEFLELVNKHIPYGSDRRRPEDLMREAGDLRWCKYHHMGTKIVDFPSAACCHSSLESCILERDLQPMKPCVLAAILDTRPITRILIGRSQDSKYYLVARLFFEEGDSEGYIKWYRTSRDGCRIFNGDEYVCEMPVGMDAQQVLYRELERAEFVGPQMGPEMRLQNEMTADDYHDLENQMD